MQYAKKLLLLAAGMPLLAAAQTGTEWNDASITQVNREPAHTLELPAMSGADAVIEHSPYYTPLSGVWKFRWVPSPDKKPAGFERTDYDDSAWDDIAVPSTWQIYGLRHDKPWDRPLYTNSNYPFRFDEKTFSVMAPRPADWTYNDSMPNPVGSYRRVFRVHSDEQGRDFYLRFNGAGHGFYVWLNGHFVGYSEDSYLPSEFRVTDYVNFKGDNVLAVQVYRFTTGSLFEDQDYWRLTGIMRDVFLWSAPKAQIRDFFATTTFSDSYSRAVEHVSVELTGQKLEESTLSATLSRGGREVASRSKKVAAPGRAELALDVAEPKLWNAEEPNLYTLTLKLEKGGKLIDMRSCKVGMRQVGIDSEGAITINGRRIKIHGVNRHDFSQQNGRTLTREEIRADILLMKRLNINAIRTSHYPDNPYLYDLCDEMGLYVVAEANVECHGAQQLSSNPTFRKLIVERNRNQVLTLRNHPSIFIWSMGNESGPGENFRYASAAIHELDTTRLVHYEGNSNYADVSSTMYAPLSTIERIGREREAEAAAGKRPKPHFQCENTHSMGNAMGNQREYFNLYERYPALAGEFVWDWKDQGIMMPVEGTNGEYYWAYGGDFGDKPNDGNFCTNGVIFPDYTYSTKALNMKKIYQPADFAMSDSLRGTFVVRNKLAFASLAKYSFRCKVYEDGREISEHSLAMPDVPAGESREIRLDSLIPKTMKNNADYALRFIVSQREATAWAPAGYEVAAEQFTLRAAQKREAYKPREGKKLRVFTAGSGVVVESPDVRATFSAATGQLDSLTYRGRLIAKGMRLNAFRVPHDNDCYRAPSWQAMGLRDLTVSPGKWQTKENADGSATLTITDDYRGQGGVAFRAEMQYRVLADGAVSVESLIIPWQDGEIIPRIGFRFSAPKDFADFSWYGRGPGDSYRDRKECCFPSVWQSRVKEQVGKFMLPQESGNKEDVRYFSLTGGDKGGFSVLAPTLVAASVSDRAPEDMYTSPGDRKRHLYEVPKSDMTVVCVDAAMRGLGNNSCGPDVIEKYELRTRQEAMQFMIIPTSGVPSSEALRSAGLVSAPVAFERAKDTVCLRSDGERIFYSIDGKKYKPYTTPIIIRGGQTLRAYSETDGLERSMTSVYEVPAYVSKKDWRVVACSDEEGGSEKAANAIDEDPRTIWHSQYTGGTKGFPREITVDMGRAYDVAAFVYTPRTDGISNGLVKGYAVYLSADGKSWKMAAEGEFANSAVKKTVTLASPMRARYFRFVGKSEVNGNDFCSAAELGILTK